MANRATGEQTAGSPEEEPHWVSLWTAVLLRLSAANTVIWVHSELGTLLVIVLVIVLVLVLILVLRLLVLVLLLVLI